MFCRHYKSKGLRFFFSYFYLQSCFCIFHSLYTIQRAYLSFHQFVPAHRRFLEECQDGFIGLEFPRTSICVNVSVKIQISFVPFAVNPAPANMTEQVTLAQLKTRFYMLYNYINVDQFNPVNHIWNRAVNLFYSWETLATEWFKHIWAANANSNFYSLKTKNKSPAIKNLHTL